jgi:hypothetical protein
MKKIRKGCFIGLLIILTVVIAGIIYFFKYHKNEVQGIFKPVVLSSLKNDIFEKLNKIHSNNYKDSLKSIVSDYITQIKNKENFNLENAGHFFDNIKIILSDSVIDSLEIKNIRNLLIKDMVEYERSKKN